MDAQGQCSGKTPTGLLVSVRGTSEALGISHLPIEVMDLKEPDRGPLGPCNPDVWHQCVEHVPFAGHWSVALGEPPAAVELAKHVPQRMDFAKAGAHRLRTEAHVLRSWQTIRDHLSPSTELVAVAYADYAAADGISPERTLAALARSGVRTMLVDTFGKRGPTSLEILGQVRIRSLVDEAAECGCDIVLAGGIRLDSLSQAVASGVRRVGARGALCRGGRTGTIDLKTLSCWIEYLSHPARPRTTN